MQRNLILMLGLTLVFCCSIAQPTTDRGVFRISSEELHESYQVTGDWAFYWDQLLEPGDLALRRPTEWLKVPGVWESKYQALGCATYRAQIMVDKPLINYSIFFPVINSAAKIWLNGELVEEIGVVSRDRSVYAPKLSSAVITIPSDTTQIDLIIQVANYTYFNGGITRTPYINKSSALYRSLDAGNGLENFFAGSLIAMFLYQVILFVLYQRGISYLWLAMICLTVALRALVTHGGSFLLPNLFDSVHWEYWKKLEFFSVYANVALFPLYIHALFKETAPRWPIRLFVVLAILLCASVLVTPQYVYGRLLDVCHLALILAFVYAIYSVARAWRGGNSDARIIFFGVICSFPFILLEILRNTRVLTLHIGFAYLVELGVLTFLLFQIYLLANYYSRSYRRLETINQDLEEIVAARTEELHKANSVKDRLLSVMSHDIKSPLNSLKGILQIFNMGGITQDEFGKFSRQIEGDLSSTSMLVDNILFWTASQLKGVKVVRTSFDLKEVINENIELFQSVADNKNIRIIHDLDQSVKISTDKNILNMVLRNLISNAVKFSTENSEIRISFSDQPDDYVIAVIDHGVGMSKEARIAIFNPKESVSMPGTMNEKGTGIGLSLCREYLEKAGGMLRVSSEAGRGTSFSVILPKNPTIVDDPIL